MQLIKYQTPDLELLCLIYIGIYGYAISVV